MLGRNNFKFICLVIGLIASVQQYAHAEGGKFEASLAGGNLRFSTAASHFDLAPALYYKPLATDLLQVGLEVGYHKTSHQGNSATNMTFLGGVTLNMGAMPSAVFCSLGAAMEMGSAGDYPDASMDDPNGFGFHFICGKRLPLGPGWSIRPSVGVVSVGTTGMVFRPLAVSYMF